MTALAAFWSVHGGSPDADCARMLAAQAIYGPDGAAQATRGSLAVGRRLFRLTREDDLDRGPVRGQDAARIMVADVRIDNRDVLAGLLSLPPATLAELSDPALLMQVLDRWGVAGLAKVVGPFALILWDEASGRLTLARDPMGERPLHYHRGEGFVAVASMPKGLHALSDVPYAASAAAAADFLALIPETGTESFFVGIARVLPGECVTIDAAGVSSERFWTWPSTMLTLPRDEDYALALRAAFDVAVRRRLRVSGGEIAAHLSAGLDSGAVAATAARLLAPGRLFAFTAVPTVATETPRGTIADEGPLAARTAALHPTMDHVAIRSASVSPLSLLDRQFHLFERPVLNPSNAVWADAIADAARARGVRVLLTGQMGNLTISHAGMQHLPELLRQGRPFALARLARQIVRRGGGWKSIAAATVGPFLAPRLWAWLDQRFSSGAPLAKYSAIRAEAVAQEGVEARAAARGLDLGYRPWHDGRRMRLWALARVDMGVYNKGVLAGWGIDMRDPTIDRDLVALCLSIPERQYILDGVPRSLARRAFADRLPPDVIGERRRGFQAADWHVALTPALAQIAAELDSFDRAPVAAHLVDTERLRASLDEWPTDQWNDSDRIARYQLSLMRGVAAGHFLRKIARTN